MTPRIAGVVLGLGGLLVGSSPAFSQFSYHHVHLMVPDGEEATRWYIEHMGCGPVEGRADAALCNSTKLYFFGRPSNGPSVGTGVDHIGFAVADLEAAMARLEAAGLTLDGPLGGDAQDPFRSASLTQWGTRIELVETDGRTGFHHVHLSSPDPDTTLAWYHEAFGGERTSLQGQDALRYSGAVPTGEEASRADVWLFASQAAGTVAPNEGRAVDHLGFSVAGLHEAATELQGKGVVFGVEPDAIRDHSSGQPFGRGHLTLRNYSFVTGPDEVWIEVVECFDPEHCGPGS